MCGACVFNNFGEGLIQQLSERHTIEVLVPETLAKLTFHHLPFFSRPTKIALPYMDPPRSYTVFVPNNVCVCDIRTACVRIVHYNTMNFSPAH